MKIAIIGLGSIAQKAYLPILTQLPDIELVFCTRNQDTLQQLAFKYGVKETYQDYRQLSHISLDAVMIHSSTASHYEIASCFLQQGIPTFVDKPLSDNGHDCEKLYELAERTHTILYMGFNRRFIPLFNSHLNGVQTNESEETLLSLRWEKNRHDVMTDLRSFIFDDFIHPLDSINLYGKQTIDDVHIVSQFSGENLARLDVQWMQNDSILHASMNRSFGITTETVSANYKDISYQFSSFVEGTLWKNNIESVLRLPDWTSMLTSKGFSAMIEDWLNVIKIGKLQPAVITRNLGSHQLAQAVYDKLKTTNL